MEVMGITTLEKAQCNRAINVAWSQFIIHINHNGSIYIEKSCKTNKKIEKYQKFKQKKWKNVFMKPWR